jgi:hypothetical protein
MQIKKKLSARPLPRLIHVYRPLLNERFNGVMNFTVKKKVIPVTYRGDP